MEYISREAAIVRASNAIKTFDGTAHDVKEALKTIPAEDVRPVVHGKWEKRHVHRGGFRRHTGIDDRGEEHTITVDERVEFDDLYCSSCGAVAPDNFLNFCPNCGAKMDGGETA